MPLLNILLASDYISCFSSDFTPSESFQKLSESVNSKHEAVFAYLSDFLSNLNISGETGKSVNVNFILDHNFVGYYYFKLPPVNRRKLGKIIGFELEDSLLGGVDELYFDYRRKTVKKGSSTETGVYTIDKEFLNALIEICKKFGLELKGVFPLNDLLDIKIQESLIPENHIYISPEEKFARIFVYKEGFLIDFSTVLFPEAPIVGANLREHLQAKIDLINRKILSVSLYSDSDYKIIPDEEARSIAVVNDDEAPETLEPADAENLADAGSPIILKDLAKPSILNKARRINLLKSNLLFVKELKKRAKPLIFSAAVIAVCLVVYVGLIVYKGVTNYREYQKLNREYTAHVGKYLSKGTSKANALYILKDKVKNLKKQTERDSKFARREYKILTLLKQFSLFKKEAPSFILNSFYLADNSIRIKGLVASLDHFENIKERVRDVFPKKTHDVSYHQESRGGQTFNFKITIRKSASQPGRP